jgi:hypothetical protein
VRDQGPFDGFLGFSQGACFAGLLPALMDLHSPKFVILVGGFKSRATAHKDLISPAPMEPKISAPSLHIIGTSDEWVVPDRSKELLFCYDEKTRSVLEHPGGHYIPSDASSKQKIVDWISQFAINE